MKLQSDGWRAHTANEGNNGSLHRNLIQLVKGSHCNWKELLRRESPVCRRISDAIRNERWRAHTASKGSCVSLLQKGEPRHPPNKQRDTKRTCGFLTHLLLTCVFSSCLLSSFWSGLLVTPRCSCVSALPCLALFGYIKDCYFELYPHLRVPLFSLLCAPWQLALFFFYSICFLFIYYIIKKKTCVTTLR